MADTMELRDIEVWDGNMAASHALRQAQVDVVAAYPITPSTPIVETTLISLPTAMSTANS